MENHQENSTKILNSRMDRHHDYLGKEIIEKEKISHTFKSLQKTLGRKKDFILLVNIRSLNANHVKLQLFIENLEFKPAVIICTETRVLQSFEFFLSMVIKFTIIIVN